jgi:hypothetical protein
MYYDDQAKRFNLVSGLLCGTVLGAGVGLLLISGRVGEERSTPSLRKSAATALERARGRARRGGALARRRFSL